MKSRRNYEAQFKKDAVVLVEKTGKSVSEVASNPGIRYDVLSRWIRESKSGNPDVFPGKGNCWDNACAESFFSTLKKEEVYRRSYKSRKDARILIFEYITTFYNNTRKHSFLDYLSPESFELKWLRKNA